VKQGRGGHAGAGRCISFSDRGSPGGRGRRADFPVCPTADFQSANAANSRTVTTGLGRPTGSRRYGRLGNLRCVGDARLP
jgi:hypothetical protein